MAFVFYSFIFRCAGNIEGARLSDGVTSIVAIDFGSFLILHLFIKYVPLLSYICAGLKDALFNLYLIQDAAYLLFGLLIIFLSVRMVMVMVNAYLCQSR